MVLSNKKLKQKLKAAQVDSLNDSVSATKTDKKSPTANIDAEAQTQHLEELLFLAKQRQKLKKKDKRKKALSENVNSSGDGDIPKEKKQLEEAGKGQTENKDEKKRKKRDRNEEKAESGGDSVVNKTKEVKQAMKKTKKKKKKKKKKTKNEGDEKANGFENGEQKATEVLQDGQSQESREIGTKVYVGGIPYYSSEDDIRSYFESCGSITEVDCMKFPETGKFRGIAILSFKTEAAARRALALDGSDMGGLFLKIQPYKSTRPNKTSDFNPQVVEGYNRIYVGNLSWDITEDDLRKLFSGCNISSVRFGMDKETGEFRGYAHVDFSDSVSLRSALELDQRILCGRPVRITRAVPLRGGKVNTTAAPTVNDVPDKTVSAPGSGKLRRRICYECGEKGHNFSACPNKKST